MRKNNRKMLFSRVKRILKKFPYLVRAKRYLDIKLGLSSTLAVHSYKNIETVDRQKIIEKMLNYWKKELRVSEITAQDWLRAALNFDYYIYNIEQMKKRFGALKDKKVADIGCGWGSLLLMLSKEEAILQACDKIPIHVEVAQMRVPTAKVIQADARNLQDFEDESFDFVIEHDVFEHIGDYAGDAGPIGQTYNDKLINLKELRRIMKSDGKGFLSTGNFSFPYNGEVHLWFVHWLPYEHQTQYLNSLKLNSDRYWLCTWKQIEKLFSEAELKIDEVYTPPHDVIAIKNNMLKFLKKIPSINIEFENILQKLMSTHPEYMPTWMIFFSKI